MLRKNRRYSANWKSSTMGVDLNRNYDSSYSKNLFGSSVV